MGPTGRFLQPLGNMSFDSIYDTYREQADALIEGGVDFIIIETIIDVQEMRAALLASLDAREAAGKTKEDVQIICQFSFSEDGRTITGTPPAVATAIVEAIGADIIGINCSLGPCLLYTSLSILDKRADNCAALSVFTSLSSAATAFGSLPSPPP